MRIRAVRVQGEPPQAPLQADFTSQGGTIGRGSDCTLVLPDPYKHVSRMHAQIAQVDGQWLLTDHGSANPVVRNGQEVGRGRQVPLADGDVLVIGDYELRVQMLPMAPGAPATAGTSSALPPTQFWNSLLPQEAGSDPLAGLLGQDEGIGRAPDSSPEAAFGPDPFAPDPRTEIRQAGASVERDFPLPGSAGGMQAPPGAGLAGPALGEAAPESLDALFGLGVPGTMGAEAIGDAGRPPADRLQGNDPLPGGAGRGAGESGPFEALGWGNHRPPSAAPVSDHAPSWQESFSLPRPAAAATQMSVPAHPGGSAAPVSSAGVSPSAAATSSTEQEGGSADPSAATASASISEAAKRLVPTVSTEQLRDIIDEAAAAHAASFAPLPKTQPTERIEEINRRNAAAAAQHSCDDPAASTDALLAQLLVGLQMPGLPRALGDTGGAPPLDPRLMRRLGELLRLSLQGVLTLLAARATVKQEMRADLTVIAERANNPLKFSPDVLSALTHLLSPQPMRGFMDPAASVRDAYDDLLAHQVAYVAAMRAAMQQLLERFDPSRLEARLSGNRRMLDTVLPGARKARLWELFSDLFGEISREAEDDFEALFGKAFRIAYEEQVRRLRETPGNPE